MKLFNRKTKKPKNAANVASLQFIPTWKIKEILDSPNCTGIDGRDYGPVRHELESILHERNNRVQEWTLRKALHGFERARREKIADIFPDEAYIPAAPKAMAVEAFDLDRVEVVSVVREFWKINRENGGFDIVDIPPMIMSF